MSADLREYMDTSRGYEDLEVFRELLRRHPPRCDFVKHIDLFMGPADDPESAPSYWLASWERSYDRWSRLFESIPTLPACTTLDLNALHVHLLQYISGFQSYRISPTSVTGRRMSMERRRL